MRPVATIGGRALALAALLLLLPLIFAAPAEAQGKGPTTLLSHSPMLSGEEKLTFDLSFALGFVKGSVGTSTLSTTATEDGGRTTRLLLKTKNAVELFYPMRDTMQTWYDRERLPQLFYKGIEENKFRARDSVTYNFTPDGRVATRAMKYNDDGTVRSELDTCLYAGETAVLDLISMIAYVRAVPEAELTKKGYHTFIIPLEGKLIEGRFTFLGYKTMKYRGSDVSTMEVSYDIGDPGFKKNRDTLRIYITRDARRLPVFVRAELAIGSVDCRLVSDQ